MILWYQRGVEGRPSPCRFTPSCSSYALEALEVHGTWRGLRLTLRRLVRCRPFGPSGWDPVPPRTVEVRAAGPTLVGTQIHIPGAPPRPRPLEPTRRPVRPSSRRRADAR